MEAASTLNGAGAEQLSLPGMDDYFLARRLEESRRVVREVAARSEKPLIIQFSGGRDSMAVLGLVQEVTNDFVCSYMASGMEFKGILSFVKETCQNLNVRLLISTPEMHKGDIFKRVKKFKSFPNISHFSGGGSRTWCSRDLKIRPQKKMLVKEFGRGTFYKLEGVRMYESSRRRYIYADYADYPIREDAEFKGSYEVFPILNWTDRDVLNYLRKKGLPTSGLYKEFGVSGCSWCPFYQPEIYKRVLEKMPNHYDRFIELEEELGIPSVAGYYFLRDLKEEVLTGVPAKPLEIPGDMRNDMVKYEGEMVRACSVYGHIFVDGKCLRCEENEPVY
jgi:phosphoadenosine phosphosulfate reductase